MGLIQTDSQPRAVIIAGPNGAGKTTFAREFMPSENSSPAFINADLIAAGLSPFRPEAMAMESSRIMLEQMQRCVEQKISFAVETTLAGKSYVNFIKKWRNAGYIIELIFLKLPSPELAIQRVKERVAQGGHNIPETDIRRRFIRGRENFDIIYKEKVNYWRLYDASIFPPVLISKEAN